MPSKILNNGFILLFDEEDRQIVESHEWYAMKQPHCHIYYVVAPIRDAKTRRQTTTVRFHRLVMGVTDPKIGVDHINRNGLDNRRQNLRLASQAQNLGNTKTRTDNRSGYKGVGFHRQSRLWRARLKGKLLGLFKTPEQAA